MLFFRRLALTPVNKFPRSCRFYSGLLSGMTTVKDIKDSKFYTSSLNIEETAEFMEKNKYLYEAAKKDVPGETKLDVDEYINSVKHNVSEFILKKEVWDREEIKDALKSVFSRRGQFVCLLGGSSTGKSLLLHEIHEKSTRLTLLVDMRSGKPLMRGLVDELIRSQYFLNFLKDNGKELIHVVALAEIKLLEADVGKQTSESIGLALDAVVKALLKENKSHMDIFQLLLNTSGAIKGPLIITVDAADIAFDSSTKSPEKIEAIKRDLSLFVHLTKQTHAANIVLASPDHSFPYKLQAVGFNTADFTDFMFMGEVPPDKMYELLTEKWGMRENLAIAFMEFYGGHVYDCSKAINELAWRKEKFRADVIYMGSHEGIGRVQRKFKGTEHEGTVEKYLNALATSGFLKTLDELDDPVVKLLSENNVAGVVTRDGITVGLPETVWTDDADVFGLIPAKQSTRMMIARRLKK